MNQYSKTIREKVKYPNTDGQYGEWDCLNWEQRKFLIKCADFMDGMDAQIQTIYREGFEAGVQMVLDKIKSMTEPHNDRLQPYPLSPSDKKFKAEI